LIKQFVGRFFRIFFNILFSGDNEVGLSSEGSRNPRFWWYTDPTLRPERREDDPLRRQRRYPSSDGE